MLKKLEPYEEIVRKAGDEPIGTSKVLLEASHKICRLKECNMVNLIADSFLAYYADRNSTIPGAWSDVNAAVVNAGITRTSIQQGTVLRKHVMEAMPFESSLVVLTMNGNQLQKMFDYGISKFTWYGDPEGSFLQVSGMRVTYNFSRPQHKRTEKLKILCAKCSVPKYEPVDPTVTYKIVTTSFMARGGDGFKFDKEVLDSMKTEGTTYGITSYAAHDPSIAPGVIHGITQDYSDEDIDDLHRVQSKKIIQFRRLRATNTIIVILEGPHLPRYAVFALTPYRIYPPRVRTTQCRHCFRIDHQADVCPHKQAHCFCKYCGQHFPPTLDNEIPEQECILCCLNCKPTTVQRHQPAPLSKRISRYEFNAAEAHARGSRRNPLSPAATMLTGPAWKHAIVSRYSPLSLLPIRPSKTLTGPALQDRAPQSTGPDPTHRNADNYTRRNPPQVPNQRNKHSSQHLDVLGPNRIDPLLPRPLDHH
ncbi:protein 5NUC-like [Ixodes scapularis]